MIPRWGRARARCFGILLISNGPGIGRPGTCGEIYHTIHDFDPWTAVHDSRLARHEQYSEGVVPMSLLLWNLLSHASNLDTNHAPRRSQLYPRPCRDPLAHVRCEIFDQHAYAPLKQGCRTEPIQILDNFNLLPRMTLVSGAASRLQIRGLRNGTSRVHFRPWDRPPIVSRSKPGQVSLDPWTLVLAREEAGRLLRTQSTETLWSFLGWRRFLHPPTTTRADQWPPP